MTTIASLLVGLGLDASDYNTNLSKASRDTSSFVDRLSGGFGGLGTVATGALLRIGEVAVDTAIKVGGALFDQGQSAIKVSGDFEAGMNQFEIAVGRTLDGSGKSLNDFKSLFISLGKELPVSTSEVEKAATEMARGGIDPAVIAADGLKRTIQFAAASLKGDLVSAAQISAKTMQAWTQTTDSAATKTGFLTHAQDMMTQATTAASTTVDQLFLGLSNVGGTARLAGVSFDETVTALAQLTPSFSSSADAGTSMKVMLSRLLPTTTPAIDAMTSLGLYTEKTGSAFYDSKGKFIGMAKAEELLHGATKNLTDAQRESVLQTIFGQDAIRAAAVFANQGAAGYDALAVSIGKQSNVQQAAAIAQKGYNVALDNFYGSIEALRITLGGAIIPLLTTLLNTVLAPGVNTITTFADGFVQAGDKVGYLKTAVAQGLSFIYQFTAAAYDLLRPLGILGTAAGMAVDLFGFAVSRNGEYLDRLEEHFAQIIAYIQTSLPGWIAILQGWGTAAWQWIVDASLSAVARLRVWATQLTESATAALPGWMATLQQWATAAWQWISNAVPLALTTLLSWRNELINYVLTSLPGWIDALAQWAITLGQWIIDAAPKALASFTFYTTQLIGYIGAALPGIIDKLNYWSLELLNWITGSTPGATSELGVYVGQILDSIGKALPGIVNSLGKWAAALAEWIIDVWPKLYIGLLDLVTTVGAWIGERVPVIAVFLAGWIESFAAWVEKVWPTLETNISKMADALFTWIGTQGPILVQKLATWAGAFFGFIGPYIPQILIGLGTMLSDILTWIIQRAPDFIEKLKTWGTALGNWVTTTAIPYLQQEIPKLWEALKTWFTDKARDIQADGSIGQALVNGIKAGVSATWASFTGYLSGQWDGLVRDTKNALNAMPGVGIYLMDALRNGMSIQIGTVTQLATNIGMSIKDKIMEWTGALTDAGAALIQNFWQGIQNRWNQMRNDLGGLLQQLRNMLPGSEPKDSSSPLRRLGDAGSALIGNIQEGIDGSNLTITPHLQSVADSLRTGVGGLSVETNLNGTSDISGQPQVNANIAPSTGTQGRNPDIIEVKLADFNKLAEALRVYFIELSRRQGLGF